MTWTFASLAVADIYLFLAYTASAGDGVALIGLRITTIIFFWASIAALVAMTTVSTLDHATRRYAGRAFSFVLLALTTSWTIVRWGFTLALGFEPSGSVLSFLYRDAGQLLLHGLQTMPTVVGSVSVLAFTTSWLLRNL